MQWQFRKALQSFEGYKRTTTFKNQIQNGQQGVLDVVLREIEMILADKAQKIVTKVLALRFLRDIMVLGQEQVVKRVEKLIPQLSKICSHELGSSDPDRGQTYFHDHATYIKAAGEDERKQIDTLGSTYFILSLESIYHWARWIPLDSSGQESIYARAYQNMVDAGVKFPNSFHYYKQSDTEKFKNMYKMEFFTDSYDSAYSGVPSQMQHSNSESRSSRITIDANNKSIQLQNRSKPQVPRGQGVVEQYTGQTRSLKTVAEMMTYLNNLRREKGRKMGDLRDINRKVQDMFEIGESRAYSKQQQRWIQKYLINFGLLNSSLISYEQFIQRCVSQQLELDLLQQQDISIDHKASRYATNRSPNALKGDPSKFAPSERDEDLFKKQQFEYKTKLNNLLMELQQRNNQLAIIKSNAQKQRSKLVEDYQARIMHIKSQVKKGHQDKGTFEKQLQKENQRLKAKVTALQQELATFSYSTARERDLQSQRNQLLTKVKKLQIENDKLYHAKSTKNNIEKEVAGLQATIKDKQAAIDRVKSQLRKSEKQMQNYIDQAALYKSQLINQRGKHDQKLASVTKNLQLLQIQNKQMKQKQLQLRKTLDLKQIQVLNLRQQLKRYQLKVKDIRQDIGHNNKSQHFLKSRGLMQSPVAKSTPIQQNEMQVYSNDKRLKFNNYEDLYLQLKPNNKELFIRLCRCGLKKKDILLKDNQLQIGIITQNVSQQCLKFILHFTNTSEKQVQNLQLDYNMPQSYLSTLDYQIDNKYVFCIQPQEQQKIVIKVSNKQPPFLKQRAILQLSYDKNGVSHSTNIFLPYLIIKFYDFFRPKPYSLPDRARNPRELIQIKFNRKVLPKAASIKSYFQQAQQTSTNKFEFDGFHRLTQLSVRIIITISMQTQSLLLDVLSLKEKINDKQKYVFQQLISFLEAAFKK